MPRRLEAVAGRGEPTLFLRVMQGGALPLMVLVMGACSKEPPALVAPATTAPRVETPPVMGAGSDPSVPDAASVLAPSAVPKADPAAGRTNNAMSRSQESGAMPMPGQNNDHSAPVDPAKQASAP